MLNCSVQCVLYYYAELLYYAELQCIVLYCTILYVTVLYCVCHCAPVQESPPRSRAVCTIVRPVPRTGITPAKERERKAMSVIKKVIGFQPTSYNLGTLGLSSGPPLITVS